MVSLERCIAAPRLQQVKADRAGFGPLGADAMANRLFGIFRHQRLELGFGALMVQEGLPGNEEYPRKFRPRIRRTHIHNSDRRDPRLWWFDTKEARRFTTLDAAPELPFSRNDQVLV